MKNYIYILVCIFTTSALAQNISTIELEKQKLKQALSYSDQTVATSAMYNIISLEGPQSSYKDSLAYMYFNARNYVSCYLVAEDILKYKPNNEELIEMKAVSLETMGALEKAIESYNLLLSKSNNNYHAYKIAGLQLALKKYDEALSSIKKAASMADNEKVSVSFQINKNYNQNVQLKPAIAYLEGLIYLGKEMEKEAKASLERAVQLFPDFVLAKSKLATLEPNPEE
jgi:tetratricopeptide (TPR) repeat protein